MPEHGPRLRIRRKPGSVETMAQLAQLETGLTVYSVKLSHVPSPAWRAAFLRPPDRRRTSTFTPDLGRVDLRGDTVIFRTAQGRLDVWLGRIDTWIAYANSVVEE
jgi:hypothetical protein